MRVYVGYLLFLRFPFVYLVNNYNLAVYLALNNEEHLTLNLIMKPSFCRIILWMCQTNILLSQW